MTIFINSGSGPVAGATLEQAVLNMQAFARDAELQTYTVEGGDDQGDGRFRFVLRCDRGEAEVDMPGLPLDRVRWVDESSGSIWDFPRLYVDGASWIWAFALMALFEDEDTT